MSAQTQAVNTPAIAGKKGTNQGMNAKEAIFDFLSDHRQYTSSEVSTVLSDDFKESSIANALGAMYVEGLLTRDGGGIAKNPYRYTLKQGTTLPARKKWGEGNRTRLARKAAKESLRKAAQALHDESTIPVKKVPTPVLPEISTSIDVGIAFNGELMAVEDAKRMYNEAVYIVEKLGVLFGRK